MGGAVVKLAGLDPDKALLQEEKIEKRAHRTKSIKIGRFSRRNFVPNENITGQDMRSLRILQDGLNFDVATIDKFYSIFCMADEDHSSSLDIEELLQFFAIEPSRFNKRLMTFFDADHTGTVDFLEFVCGIWNVCTWAEELLPALMFRIYDDDASGTLSLDECKHLLTDVYELRTSQREVEILLQSLMEEAENGIYKGERVVKENRFIKWSLNHKESYHPLYCAFILLRNRVMGASFWDIIGESGKRNTIYTLMELDKEFLGEANTKEALVSALGSVDAYKAKQAELRSKAQMWDSEGKSAVDSHMEVRMAKERIEAMLALRELRNREFAEFQDRKRAVEEREDPLSLIIRLADRNLYAKFEREFNEEWAGTLIELQDKMYDRDARYDSLVMSKPGKEEKYAQRKLQRDIPDDMRDGDVQYYSSASGQKTWAEQQTERRKHQRLAIAHARRSGKLATRTKWDKREDDIPDDDPRAKSYGTLSGGSHEELEDFNENAPKEPTTKYANQSKKTPPKQWQDKMKTQLVRDSAVKRVRQIEPKAKIVEKIH